VTRNTRISVFFYSAVSIGVLGAIALGVEAALARADRNARMPSGELIDVGPYRLNLVCTGAGSPTVLLIPGAGEISAIWGWIQPAVAQDTRVCAYDRAGRGWSDPGTGPQDGIELARDLHTLLDRAHERGPFVVVGHSFGGLHARIYASEYPAEVVGAVLLDVTHPEMFTRIPTYPMFYWTVRRASALLPTLARFGLLRLIYRSGYDSLPAQAREEERVHRSTAALARSQRDEWAEARTVMEQAAAVRSLGTIPLVVVTAGRDSQDTWLSLQEEMVSLSTNSVQKIAGSANHMSLVDTRGGAAVSIQAIQEAVESVRSGNALIRQ
jgi:pimeloyl-ACP methyl ester carboxylesterase